MKVNPVEYPVFHPELFLPQRKKNNRFIISGGPGFGKTSVIQALENRNYKSIPEISRQIIQEQMEIGGDILPWKNLSAFSNAVFEQRVNQHAEALDENAYYFYDRGIVDVMAYLFKDKQAVPTYFFEAVKSKHYNQLVFLTPPWEEIYQTDNERKENFHEAIEIHNAIEKTYQRMGYITDNIPLLSVDERVNYILSKINF